MASFFEKEFTFDRVCRIFFTSLIIIAILFAAWLIRDALIPFIVGFIIASAMMPVVRFFQYKLKFKARLIAIFATGICVLGVLTALFFLIVPPAINEFKKTGDLLVMYEAQVVEDLRLPPEIREYISKFVDIQDFKSQFSSQEFYDSIKEHIPKLLAVAQTAVAQIFNLITLVMIMLYSFFIMIYYEEIRDGFFDLLPEKLRKQTRQVFHNLALNTNRYFRGQSIVAGLVGVGFCIGFLIMGLPLAIPLGLFLGLLNMIPYAQFIGVFPTILLCALHSADTGIPFWRLIIFSLIVFAVVQTIQDTVLVPKIMGKVTGLNPAIILLCLSIGGVLFGVVGIIMALPLAPMALSYYHVYILKDHSESTIAHNKHDRNR